MTTQPKHTHPRRNLAPWLWTAAVLGFTLGLVVFS
jgi:hypothetical protein